MVFIFEQQVAAIYYALAVQLQASHEDFYKPAYNYARLF